MKRILLIPVLLLALSGCAQLSDTYKIATTTITNPVSQRDIYRAKNAYAAALELAVDWRQYCWSKPYAVLMQDPLAEPVCKDRRASLRAIQKAKARASYGLASATAFVRDNPTINASVGIAGVMAAIKAFQSAVPR